MEQRDHCKLFCPGPSQSRLSAYRLTLDPQQYILKTLISKTTPSDSSSPDAPSQPAYKYIANSTVIQHHGSTPADIEKQGRRGMHSAVGAFWNNEKDGTYTYKWEAADSKGMDIVITITWIAI